MCRATRNIGLALNTLAASGSLCFPVSSLADDLSKTSGEIPVLWAGTPGHFTTFFFQTNQISSSKAWIPDSPFPIDLSESAERARASILNPSEAGTEISLVKVAVRRLSVDTNIVPSPFLPSDPMNQWVLAFEFLLSPPPRTRFAAMLLNGSLATATNGLHPRTLGAFSPSLTVVDAQKKSSIHEPWQAIYQSDFAVPARQWSPFVEKFPLDLQALASQAASRVSSGQPSEKRDTPKLEEIYMETYLPAQALNARGMDFREHLHHWIITLRFGSGGRSESVYALLDGRILE